MRQEDLDGCKLLWQEVFKDSREYTDFYFEERAKKGEIYFRKGREIKAMVHANHYGLWNRVGQEIYNLRYIVGVATKEGFRHRGHMAALLEQVIQGSFRRKEPFLYLMPVQPKIYEPFGFACMRGEKKREWKLSECLKETAGRREGSSDGEFEEDDRSLLQPDGVKEGDKVLWLGHVSKKGHVMHLESATPSRYGRMSARVNAYLYNEGCHFIYRDQEYYRVLQKQMRAAGGDVLCMKGRKEALDVVISYMLEGDRCEITELFHDEDYGLEEVLAAFGSYLCMQDERLEREDIKIVLYHEISSVKGSGWEEVTEEWEWPGLMARIINVRNFFTLLKSMQETEIFFYYSDPLIQRNNGYYEVVLDEDGGCITEFIPGEEAALRPYYGMHPTYDPVTLWNALMPYMPQIYISDFT